MPLPEPIGAEDALIVLAELKTEARYGKCVFVQVPRTLEEWLSGCDDPVEVARSLQRDGKGVETIAEVLNRRGHRAANGRAWKPKAVYRMLRLALENAGDDTEDFEDPD